MITFGNASHLAVIILTTITGGNDNRFVPYPFPQGFQEIHQPEIQYHPLAAGTLEFRQQKIL